MTGIDDEPESHMGMEILLMGLVLVFGIGLCVFMFSTIGTTEDQTVNATVLEKRLMPDGDVYYYTDNTTAPLYSAAGTLWPGCIEVGSTYMFEYRNSTDTTENGTTIVYRIKGAMSI
jgi:hypothetical protein